MVLLTVTPTAKAAIEQYCQLSLDESEQKRAELETKRKELSKLEPGNPIDHSDLIDVSRLLVKQSQQENKNGVSKEWRLDTLLKGANVYQPPPAPKPEPTSEYKALMKRLRAEEERQQYERMVNPPPPAETFSQRFPNAATSFGSSSLGQFGGGADEIDEMTYADVNRQMALIINVLVSIICCSVAIWIMARRWDVPQRLGLSMSGSGLVAIAEVAIYFGYIRRIKDAKGKELRKVERKEVTETWVLDGAKGGNGKSTGMNESVRFRKGKHR